MDWSIEVIRVMFYMPLIEYLQNILVSKLILACFCYLQFYSAKRLNNVNKQH